MKLHVLNRSSTGNSSFTAKINKRRFFLKVWHSHPELELTTILKSNGAFFIGDSIEKFTVGDMVLIGKNLPHMLLNDEDYFKKNSKLYAEALAVHFKEDFLGTSFFRTPEMSHLFELFERARFGIKFLNIDKNIIEDVQSLLHLKGFEKSIKFLKILNELAKHKSYKLLASQGYINSFQNIEYKSLDSVHAYIFKNFQSVITLEEVSKIANMSTAAFSRFFKRINGKTFSRYITEIRIGYACKLLLEDKYNIATICYESGFQNISNFNRQFKLLMDCTPTSYLNTHRNK